MRMGMGERRRTVRGLRVLQSHAVVGFNRDHARYVDKLNKPPCLHERLASVVIRVVG